MLAQKPPRRFVIPIAYELVVQIKSPHTMLYKDCYTVICYLFWH